MGEVRSLSSSGWKEVERRRGLEEAEEAVGVVELLFAVAAAAATEGIWRFG
jgi:hypothetical protein